MLNGGRGRVIIVTSRASLQLSGGRELSLAPLAIPPADRSAEAIAEYASVRLFVDRATSINPAFVLSDHNAGAVPSICARLDGLPLALGISGGADKDAHRRGPVAAP